MGLDLRSVVQSRLGGVRHEHLLAVGGVKVEPDSRPVLQLTVIDLAQKSAKEEKIGK